MSWSYRVTKQSYAEEVEYTIREVYYDEHGNVEGWTKRGVGISGDSLKELRSDLEYFLSAFNYPVLDLDKYKESVLD